MTAIDQQEVREGENCTWYFIYPKRRQMMKENTTRCEERGQTKSCQNKGRATTRQASLQHWGLFCGHFCSCERTQRNRMENEQHIRSYVKIKPTCKCLWVPHSLVPPVYFFVCCFPVWSGEETVLNYSSLL